MAAEHSSVGEDGIVADRAVMAKMPAGHHVIAVADRRCGLRLEGAMDCDVFAKDVALTDHHPADVLGSPSMLRSTANHAMLAEFVLWAGLHARFHHRARGDRAVVAEFDVSLHAGKRTDAHADAQTGLGTHVRQRMNAHGVFHAG
jgi:hypothetical protein